MNNEREPTQPVVSDDQAAAALNADIRSLFRQVLRFPAQHPAILWFLCRAFYRQWRAIRRREENRRRGIPVPAFMIVSVTAQCNLRCAGCYSAALHEQRHGHLQPELLRKLLSEARDLGVGMVLITGGEPFAYPGLLDILGAYPDIIFPVFTNGQYMDEAHIRILRRHRHIIPVISLEGGADETDARRGAGVYATATAAISRLAAAHLLSGVSVTVTRQNFSTVFGPTFIKTTVARGSRLVFFVEYVPVSESAAASVPVSEQVQQIPGFLAACRTHYPALFFAFPYEEELYGGCLASGRGFIHINASGAVEPCPFAPYSDASIVNGTLQDALKSPLLRVIREQHGQLSETAGGCALWKNREWLKEIAARVK